MPYWWLAKFIAVLVSGVSSFVLHGEAELQRHLAADNFLEFVPFSMESIER